jgi:ABC-type transporter Mla subunit MlaD
MSMDVVEKTDALRDFLEEPDSLEALSEAPKEFVERLKTLVEDACTEADNVDEKIDDAIGALDNAQNAIGEIDDAKSDLEHLRN